MDKNLDGPAYLVVGVTGNVGAEVAAALARSGAPVLGVVRDADREVPAGTTAVLADITRPETLAPALAQVEGMFMLSGYDGAAELLGRAADAGVRRVVLLSAASVEGGHPDNAMAGYHQRAEQDVAGSGLAWTFLRPQAFATNALRWVPQLIAGDEVRLQFPDLPVACVDPYDLGELAAVALRDGEHDGRAYRVSGPEALLPAEQLAVLAGQLSRPLRAVPLTDAGARQQMLAADTPQRYVDALFRLNRGGEGDESVVTSVIPTVLGRPAGTFSGWVARNLDRFR